MEKKYPKCCKCGKVLGVGVTQQGNICRDTETYCEDCWKDVSEEEKKIISFHFSCDWL